MNPPLAAVLAVLSVLAASARSQDTAEAEAVLAQHVARAAALLANSETTEARAAVLAAWRIVEAAPRDQLDGPEVQENLRLLGYRAYLAGELRIARDAYALYAAHRERTLPEDHPEMREARCWLALTELAASTRAPEAATPPAQLARLAARSEGLLAQKKPVEARAAVQEAGRILAELSAAQLEDSGVQVALVRLGEAAYRSGEPDIAHAVHTAILAHRRRTLPDGHYELRWSLGWLAYFKDLRGDWKGALTLYQERLDICSRTLPDDHPDLQAARASVGFAKSRLGDLEGALALQQKAFEVCSRTLPDDHPGLDGARATLGTTKYLLGDLTGALTLQQKVLEYRSRTLPDDDPVLQIARSNLALTKHTLGDFQGALALAEKGLEILSRALPDDHPDLQSERINLAATKRAMGDLAGALALQEKVVEILARTLPDDHPDLQLARGSLGHTKRELGDLHGALALEEKTAEVFARMLPEGDVRLRAARGNLAITKRRLGDLQGALALEKEAFEFRSRTLPEDHVDLQLARSWLAWTHLELGEVEPALAMARACGVAAVRRVGAATLALAPRAAGAFAVRESHAASLLLTMVQGFGEQTPVDELAELALLTSQALRGAETRAARRARRARAVDRQRAGELEAALRVAAAEVSRIAGGALDGEADERAAKLRTRNDELRRAVLEKERLQQALSALAAGSGGGFDPTRVTTHDFAGRLPARSAAAAIVSYSHVDPDPARPGNPRTEPRLVGLVLTGDGRVQSRRIAPLADVEALVETFREQITGRDRGLRPDAKASVDPIAVQRKLRALVLDPILAACGDVDSVFVSLDESLQLVPLDALPRDDGEPVGAMVALRPLVSLFDLLLEEPSARSTDDDAKDEAILLALGDIDYKRPPKQVLAAVGGAALPPVERTRTGRPDGFVKLFGTGREVRLVGAYFEDNVANGVARILTRDAASKAQFAQTAPTARYVHVATHGYFAPESVVSTADGDTTPDALRQDRRTTGLSPLVLTGLALAGANRSPDAQGRVAGIITAEEILALDLSRCELATLSACDTSLGVRRAGQGHASLRAALIGAGSRFVLTSLWKVDDEVTMELMGDFYRRLWEDGKAPHTALWEAKMNQRAKGEPLRHWAGWVLTGK